MQQSYEQRSYITFLPYLFLAEDCQLTKSDMVNWYLKEIESDIESESELIFRKNMIEKIIHRLIHYVSMAFFYSRTLF